MHFQYSFSDRVNRSVFLFILIMTAITGNLSAQFIKADPQDSLVLLQFRHELQQEGWTIVWDITKPVTAWAGVVLDASTGKVTTIYLKQVAGTGYEDSVLPACVGLLSQLGSLKSFFAQVMGLTSVPKELGNLKQLTELGINYNKITALPAEISKLTELTYLAIGENKLTSLPDLRALTKLEHLSISANPFPAFPETICDLISLRILDAYNSSFTALPETIGKLANLESMDLKYGKLITIPASIGDLKKLKELELVRNNVTSLPATMGNMSSLTLLSASFNQITSFPAALAALPSLTYIDLRDNKLTGAIPPEVWVRPRPKRVQLDVSNNQLSGPIVIADPYVVQVLTIPGNKFLLSDISSVYNALKANGAAVTFTPQALVGTFRTFHPDAGDNISLPVDNYIAPAGSKFTWYKNNTISPFETPVKVSEQEILNIQHYNPENHRGVYYCKITHPDMPGLEQESKRIRLISYDQAPALSVVDVTGKEAPTSNFQVYTLSFRRGTSTKVWVWAYASDDYTPQQDLVWSFPDTEDLILTEAPTSDYSARQLIITPKDGAWTGTNTVKISATDESGLTTTHSIVVNVVPENNSAPVVAEIPPLYLKKDFLPCDGCTALWIHESFTSLGQFITDDIDQEKALTITIPQEDLDALNAVGISAYVSQDFLNEWTLSISRLEQQDLIFSYPLHLVVTDSQGAQATGTLTIHAIQTNDPPTIGAIADQVITTSMARFPDLDLKSLSQDDHTLPDDLTWRASESATLIVSLQGGVASVSPTRNTPYEATVIYRVYEKTNELMTRDVVVTYRVVDTGLTISGKITDQDQQPLANVRFNEFSSKTDARGLYTVTVIPGWSGTLTPVRTSYAFSPAAIEFSNVQSSFIDQNFTGSYTSTYTISGAIADEQNNPLPGITLNGFPVPVTTDANGHYSTAVYANWSGTITPSDEQYTFTPGSIAVSPITTDLPGQNFTAAIITSADEGTEATVQVYPNPSYTGKFNVQWPGHAHAMLTVYSLTGQVIIQNTIGTNQDGYVFSLPSRGMFVLKLSDSKVVHVEKIMVR
jgi:Leucine-rich repeat (LRR) protein